MDKIEYQIVFEKHGELKRTSELRDNEVWLDVGNSLGMGYFDHHHVGDYKSTLDAIVCNLHYLENLKKSAERNETIIVHMHEEPDLDCVASYYAVQYYLEKGEEEFRKDFILNLNGCKFVDYINGIDTGKDKNTTRPTLYAIFSVLDDGNEQSVDKDKMVVERGLYLLKVAVDKLFKENIDLKMHDFSEELNVKDSFKEEISIINSAKAKYEEEKNNNTVVFEEVSVWTDNDSLDKKVKAAIWEKLSECPNGYDHARKEDNVITIIPRAIKGVNGSAITRVIASVNPDIQMLNHYKLSPLVEIIEQMEQLEEQRIYEQTGVYRRDHSKPRAGKKDENGEKDSHLKKMPFGATSDPWYVSEKGDIFDAPRAGSILDYEDILAVIRNNGSTVKNGFAYEINKKLVYSEKEIQLSEWKKNTADIITKAESHVIVWAELDASLIRKDHKILEAYCMNLIGRSYTESRPNNILYLDYRTCIYSDMNCTIILFAAYDGYKADDFALYRILDFVNSQNVEDSPLVRDIYKIVEQREKLLSFGNRIGEIRLIGRRNLEKLNDEILSFSEKMQKDDMIKDPIESEVYSFVKSKFGIAELKAGIMEEIGILVNESRDKLVSKFNVISAFAVPFILIATLFQMGIFKFDELLHLSDIGKWIGWGITITLAIILVLVVYFWGKRKN